jgi:hypothetical protein
VNRNRRTTRRIGRASVYSVDVTVTPCRDGDRVEARMDFAVDDPGDGWLALDLRLWPAPSTSIRTSLRGEPEFDSGQLYWRDGGASRSYWNSQAIIAQHFMR